MKVLKNILFISFLITSFSLLAMETSTNIYKKVDAKEFTFSSLPLDIQNEIAKLLINDKAVTPKEMFKDLDNLRLSNKDTYKSTNELFKKIGREKNPRDDNYTYLKFKQDYIKNLRSKLTSQECDTIIKQKFGNLSQGGQIEGAMDIGCDVWVKSNMQDKDFFKEAGYALVRLFIGTSDKVNPYNLIKRYLDIGIEMPDEGAYKKDSILNWAITSKDTKIVELILSKANKIPNVPVPQLNKDWALFALIEKISDKPDKMPETFSEFYTQEHELKNRYDSKYIIKVANLLLSAGANPLYKPNQNYNKDSSTILDIAKKHLSDEIYNKQGKIAWAYGKAKSWILDEDVKDTEKIKTLKKLVRLLAGVDKVESGPKYGDLEK